MPCPTWVWHARDRTRGQGERVSTDQVADGIGGSAAAWTDTSEPVDEGAHALAGIPDEVVAFIRYCYQRRRIGWPELYDEMCAVAARAEFRGLDYDRLADLGVRFSLCEMTRLAALAQQVVADERRRRVAIPVRGMPIVGLQAAPTT